MKNYSFLNQAIVRAPLGIKKLDITWEGIQAIFKITKYREALFIASPTIYNALISWEKGETQQTEDELNNLKDSLYKYTSRLSNRCTPFGLWASVSTTNLAKETNINIASGKLKRTTKFDMHFLGEILTHLSKQDKIRNVLTYFPNNSIHQVMDKYRFVEYYYENKKRFHNISEVEINEYLEKILKIAKNGATITKLIESILIDTISIEDATIFINEIIDSQFLVNELEFTLTGEDYLENLMAVLAEERFNFKKPNEIKKSLRFLKTELTALDKNLYNSPNKYKEIHKYIETKLIETDIAKLFQVDSYNDLNSTTLSYNVVKKLRRALVVLNKFQSKETNMTLENFKSKFIERYEEYEQPLINVLDPDIGIGYGNGSNTNTPLINDLLIRKQPTNTRKINWDDKKSFLFKKAINALQGNLRNINLTEEDINLFDEDESLYPDSFSTFFSVFYENGEEKIYLKSTWGPSANGLIGRFSHLDTSVENICKEIHKCEKELHPTKILAEIIHLPQARTGNILYRKFQRDYEIPYLGKSSLDKNFQLEISDLYISVKRGKVILHSKRLNKEIIPRLGNAHNYSANALPIYRFLCDLQNQYQSGLSFSWGELQNDFEYLPRVSYEDVVLCRATWNLDKTAIKFILPSKEQNVFSIVKKFQRKYKISNLVVIAKGDNEVLINFENELSCNIFYKMLHGKNFIQLKEFIFKEDTITGAYCNEFILPAYKDISKIKGNPISKSFQLESQNDTYKKSFFSAGDEWLYYKFYCGERVCEKFLEQAITPIIKELKKNNFVKTWFFIRYRDKIGHHLRFRIQIKDLTKSSNCITIIKKHIEPFEKNLLIWKTQTDTYLREIHRYGSQSIVATEKLFDNDSEATLKFINLIEGDEGERLRWLFSLLSIDFLLNDFGYDLKQKIILLDVAKTNFGEEFNKIGKLNKQVNKLYNINRLDIEMFLMQNKNMDMYKPIWDILKNRSISNSEIVSKLKEYESQNVLPGGLQNIILSYLHMICNRLFISKQRIHEMVVYDMLFKYYSKKMYNQ